MTLTYQSGEEIHPGDRVTYGGNAGMIERVVDGAGNPETDLVFRELWCWGDGRRANSVRAGLHQRSTR